MCLFVIVLVGALDSYVMKLFDRSVDLAQFSQDTPLYPVCRAWIQNLSQLPATTEQPRSNEPMDGEQVERLTYDCKTLYFHCVLISRFSSVEISRHFDLPFFTGCTLPGKVQRD